MVYYIMFKKIKEFAFGPDVDEKFKVSPSTKIKYGIGNFGFNMSSGLVAAWMLNFYIKIVKIDDNSIRAELVE